MPYTVFRCTLHLLACGAQSLCRLEEASHRCPGAVTERQRGQESGGGGGGGPLGPHPAERPLAAERPAVRSRHWRRSAYRAMATLLRQWSTRRALGVALPALMVTVTVYELRDLDSRWVKTCGQLSDHRQYKYVYVISYNVVGNLCITRGSCEDIFIL